MLPDRGPAPGLTPMDTRALPALPRYTVEKAGKYLLDIQLSRRGEDHNVESTTMAQFEFEMHAAEVDASTSRLLSNTHRGPGKNIQCGDTMAMVFSLQDKYGNPIPHGPEATALFTGWFYTPAERAEHERIKVPRRPILMGTTPHALPAVPCTTQCYRGRGGGIQGRISVSQILCDIFVRNLFGVFKDPPGCAFAHLYHARGFGLLLL